MGKSSQKSVAKVGTAPAAAALTKPLKNGKRDSEEVVEKAKSAKKPKNDIKEAIAKKKVPRSNGAAVKVASEKDEESNESEDEPSSGDDVADIAEKENESSDGSEDANSEDANSDDGNSEDGNSEDDNSEESSEEEDPKQKKDVKMVDAPKAPVTPKAQSSEGGKTVFVGNLPFSVEKSDIESFFKEAGEVVDVRFAMRPDGKIKGFGHVEFASADAAKKAVDTMKGKELLGRVLRLDLAKERDDSTPQRGNEGNTFQKGEKVQVQTVFIRGLDKSEDESKIKEALQEHFGSCGEITRVSVPVDTEGSVKGIAYLDFKDKDAFNKALKLDQSELGESLLTVEEAKPRGDNGGGRGGRGGRRGGGRFGSGGRDSGGRFGGRGGGGRGRGGGGRGRGRRSFD